MFEPTPLDGVFLITPPRHTDHRGFFCETYNAEKFKAAGITTAFVQDNQSLSKAQGTLRGLHFQRAPSAQAKLVRCSRGSLFDVAVDIRRGSPTYGQSFGAELSAENGKQLLVPVGFAHGFVTLQPDTEVIYKCSAFYAPETEGCLHWDGCGIEWPFEGQPILNDRDAAAPSLDDFVSPFEYAS